MKQWEDELVLQGRGYEGRPQTFIRLPCPRTPMANHRQETAALLPSV